MADHSGFVRIVAKWVAPRCEIALRSDGVWIARGEQIGPDWETFVFARGSNQHDLFATLTREGFVQALGEDWNDTICSLWR